MELDQSLVRTEEVKRVVSEDDYSRLMKRDPLFLASLFEDINPRLLRLALSKGIAEEAAEELIQSCWGTFFENLEKFEGRSQLRTFVFGILINKIREHRRYVVKVELEEDAEKIYQRSFTADGWWVQEPHDPHKLLENKTLHLAIQECLEGLTEGQRTAFLLIEAEGESSEQACNIMGVNVSHLRVLLFRAKNKLRQCLEGV